MIKICINLSNLSKGGGAQIASWLIARLVNLNNTNFDFFFLINPALHAGLPDGLSDKNFYIIEKSPVRSFKARRQVSAIVKQQDPLFVYTLYGPSGVHFDCPEVSGVANAWISCASLSDFNRSYGIYSPLEMIKFYLHGLRLKQCCFLTFETEISRNNFCEKFNYPVTKTCLIPNTVNDYFINESNGNGKVSLPDEPFNILYVSAFYKHKNIHLLPYYARQLKESQVLEHFKFQLTLPEKNFEQLIKLAIKLGVEDCFYNFGFVEGSKLPSIYHQADMVFSPSSLETFSALYAEAIWSKKYLAVSDRTFSREICRDAAVYFDPYDYHSVCHAIESIYLGEAIGELDIALEKSNDYFITSDQRFSLIIDLLERLASDGF